MNPDDLDKTEQELTEIARRLAERFTGTFTHATVERYVFESYKALAASARLAAFLPALTERFADDRLVALAYVQKPPARPRYLDWTVPDPEGKDMVEVRRIRDELDLLVTDLVNYLPEAADGEPDDQKGTP
ncbi:three-helix bundle dimerization domain-containing protein [Catenulispora rubra]|uniref:three-helix bundle dimerization domain-containing protein n=1 Tax=Catenulispora rubra TaxID=280293 RepID=UPI0018924B40|nr:hypothetical protein [Catenulispora rubra]